LIKSGIDLMDYRDYHVYEYVVWKQEKDGSYKRIKNDIADGRNPIAAKKAASKSEGCLESEITIKRKLPQGGENLYTNIIDEDFKLLIEQIKHIYRLIFYIAKPLLVSIIKRFTK